MSISDTSDEAGALQLDILRAMTGEQRMLIALEMSLFARELAKTRIQHENPQWSDEQIARELMRIAFFPEPLPTGF